MALRNALVRLRDAMNAVRSKNITLSHQSSSAVGKFSEVKEDYLRSTLFSSLELVSKECSKLVLEPATHKLQQMASQLDPQQPDQLLKTVEEMLAEIPLLTSEQVEPQEVKINLPSRIPLEIKDQLHADAEELKRCYQSACYRSVVILCGRLMETALHRKYFEITGNDLLEKSPGIGLGKIIAKLSENEVKLDPGLTQQIHLINQVRIFSVHTKQEAFTPTKNQTHAMILYTSDILEKLFQ